MPFSVFHLSIASRNDLSDRSTAWLLSTPSDVPSMETHCVWDTAIVQGVAQKAMAIRVSNTAWAHLPISAPLSFRDGNLNLSIVRA
jgi:hypothetical protein